MQELIISYLFQYRKCPLPGVGSLLIKEEGANVYHGEKKIVAPRPFIEFSDEQLPADDLLRYIAARKNISVNAAEKNLRDYCHTLSGLQQGSGSLLDDVGRFYVDENGKLVFSSLEIPAAFLPAVPAERAIHPNDEHEMLVGDTKTTSTVMSEFYNVEDRKRNNRWWIWAAALCVIATIVSIIYFNDQRRNDAFGNAGRVEPAKQSPTYRSPD
jgi:hypothetical protein